METQEIDLDEIMEKIREKVEGRRTGRPEPDEFVLERPSLLFLTFRPVVRVFYRIPYLGLHIMKLVAFTRYQMSRDRQS